MSKTNSASSPNLLPTPVLNPLGVYTPAQAAALLGLAKSTLKAERRAGRIRMGRRGKKYYFLGSWLLEWLQGGELPFPAARGSAHNAGAREGQS